MLLEWDESIPWCDAERQRGYDEIFQLSRRIAVQIVPLGAALFVAGFWLIGRIPGGAGPMPYSTQLKFAGAWLLFWLLPYAAFRLGSGKATQGVCTHVRLHVRGIEFLETGRRVKTIDWYVFDAFELGRWNNFDLLKLRLRGNWFSRRLGLKNMAIEFGVSGVSPSSIRQVLVDRGLREEILNDPLVSTQFVPLI